MGNHQMPGHLIRRLHQISTHVFMARVQESGFDLTPVQFAAMQALRFNSGIEQAQIAALISYDRATIGGVIDRLEQKGYVTRVVSPSDRRARAVSLSEKGQRTVKSLVPVVQQLQNEILERLSESERDLFTSLAMKAAGVVPDQD